MKRASLPVALTLGAGLLLGIRLPQNFRRPYGAVSVVDFWRRWHITLSNWLRDYLYFRCPCCDRSGRYSPTRT